MSVVETCLAQIRGRGLRVVFPEAEDERILAAARCLRDEDLADPILPANPESSDRLDAYAALYLRHRPDTNPKVARRLAAKPLFHAGLMVKAGDADAMVAGVAAPDLRKTGFDNAHGKTNSMQSCVSDFIAQRLAG